MSERKTMAAALARKLGVIRAQLDHDIRELAASDWNPSKDQMHQMIQRQDDDNHEVVGLMFRVLNLEPEPLPPHMTRVGEAAPPPPEWTIE